ncbi:MAG: isochorismatase family protein [Pseudorhodoferax sp.]
MQTARQVYDARGFGEPIRMVPPYGLLLVDFCTAFVGQDALGGGNIGPAARASAGLLAEARRRAWPIAHSQIVFDTDAALPWLEKVPSLRTLTPGNPAVDFVHALAPLPGEHVVRKTVPSAFFQSTLDAWLRARSVSTLLIAGCTTSGCVRASTVDAVSHGYRPVVVADCVGDRALAAHEASLCDLGAKYANISDRSTILALTHD